jgi:hypothetical protein
MAEARVGRESAIEVFGKQIVELAEYFYRHKAPGKNFWSDLDESEKRNCLLIAAINSGMEHRTFRNKYDSLILSLSPDELKTLIENLEVVGKGCSCVESVVNLLRTGTPHSIELAKHICWYDADKIHIHSEAFALLKQTLMNNDADWCRLYENII